MTQLADALRHAGLAPDLPTVPLASSRPDQMRYLVLSAEGRRRIAHVRVASSPHGRMELLTEQAVLNRLAELPELAGTVPIPLAWLGEGRTTISVLTAAAGRSFEDLLAKRRPADSAMRSTADRVIEWLDALHRCTGSGAYGIDPAATAELMGRAGVPTDRADWAADRFGHHLDATLPTVVEHGTLSPRNVVLGPGDELAVVDWAAADIDADPFDDLLFFLFTFVRATLPGRGTLTGAVAAGLTDGDSWQSEFVRHHLHRALDRHGLPHDLAAPLTLRFLARRVLADEQRDRLPSAGDWRAALAAFYVNEVVAL